MYRALKVLSVLLGILVIAGVSFYAGTVVGRPGSLAMLPVTGGSRPAASQAEPLNTDLIQQAYKLIQDNYADRDTLQKTDLTYSAISGMVDSLGDTGHSRFLTPEMVVSENRALSGSYEGIGAIMQMKDGHPVVLAPMDNSPAQKAGLRPGDIIISVDDVSVEGKSLEDVVSMVLGPAGTQVKLTVQKPDTGVEETYTITRAKIVNQSVSWQMLPGTQIAHLRISSFSSNTGRDMKNALNEIKNQGAQGIILDLRNNPGGYVNEAVETISQFLARGNIMQEKDAQGNVRSIPVRPGGLATDIPLIVMINEGSASAAEITAGAMQDNNRAQLLGTTTFGTGTVLLNFPLDDGSALLLATEQWLTPKGRVIWHKGITPDIEVKLPSDVSPSIPIVERDLTPEQLKSSTDVQLLRAIEELQKLIDK